MTDELGAVEPRYVGSNSDDWQQLCQCCERSIKTHKWAKIHAHTEGWYEMRDGRLWCPDHRPPWAPIVATN